MTSTLLLADMLARAADTAAFAAPVTTAGSQTPGVTRVVLSLAVVLLLLFAAAWAMKRVAGMSGGANARLRTLASLSLGARERAVLIEVDGREVLLGVAPGNVRTLLVGDLPALQGDATVAPSPGEGVAAAAAALGDAVQPDLKAAFSAILRRSLGR